MAWFGSRERKVRQLEAEGFAALDAGEWSEAEALGAQLVELGWSSGFEIRALAAQRSGDADRAACILEEGVSSAADAWSLWHLLGIVRSDLRRYEAAIEAFGQALACEDADGPSILFNRAIARARRGDPAAALDDLEHVLSLPKPPPFAEDALSLAAECMAETGRGQEALALLRAAHVACQIDDPRRDRLSAELALALDRSGADEREVRSLFDAAAQAGIATPSFLALGRRLTPAVARAPRLHRIVVEAPAPPHVCARGSMRVFEVVADHREQALALALPYLPAEAREHASVVEHEDRGDRPVAEAGVLWASGFAYYEDE